MKKRILALLLCFTLLLGLLPAALTAAADGDVKLNVYKDESTVSAVTLYESSKLTLTARPDSNVSGAYQWQIKAGSQWANIVGSAAPSLELSFAMVANLLDDYGQAFVRCRFITSEGKEVYSDEITVQMDADPAQVAPMRAPARAPISFTILDPGSVVIHETDSPAPTETTAPTEVTTPTEVTDPTVTTDPTDSTTESTEATEQPTTPTETPTEAPVTDPAPAESQEPAPAAEESDFSLAAAFLDLFTVSAHAESGVMKTYNVIVNYVFENGQIVSEPYTANLAEGSSFRATVTFPTVAGYLPYLNDGQNDVQQNTLEINIENITEDVIYNVVYKPTLVDYTVNHYLQNVDDDGYAKVDSDTLHGLTDSIVGDVTRPYEGFYALLYKHPTIAADGSTIIDVYYDRYYYLMNFDLDGGYGTDPIYARYGAPIGNISSPQKAGYSFEYWSETKNGPKAQIGSTMPAENKTYYAVWTAGDSAKVTIVVWGENADDEEYSYIKSSEIQAKPGTTLTKDDLTHILTCDKEEHQHTNSCMNCAHTHTADCYGAIKQEQPVDGKTESATENINQFKALTGGTLKNGMVYRVKCDGATSTPGYDKYYLYYDNTWYLVSSSNISGSAVASSKKVNAHEHSWNIFSGNDKDQFWVYNSKLSCTHTHTDSCYTCGKVAHKHNAGCYTSLVDMDATLWKLVKSDEKTVAADGTSIINVYYDRVEFTLHFRDAYSSNDDYGTITKKWGANIREAFNQKCKSAGTSNWSEKSDAGGPWTSYLDIMPQSDKTYYAYTEGYGTSTAYYYVEGLDGKDKLFYENKSTGTGYTVTVEEFIEIEGFTFNAARSAKVGDRFNGAKFYYTRNSYTLSFYNYNSQLTEKDKTVKYEAPLGSYYFVPDYPAKLEPNAYEFGGWYTTAGCYDGSEADLNKMTMPASNLILYAKWKPITHKVEFHLTENDTEVYKPNGDDKALFEVDHGGNIAKDYVDKHLTKEAMNVAKPNGDYKFVVWYYYENNDKENGEKKYFDPTMQIREDMVLYGEWNADTLKEYTVHFVLKNDLSVKVADDVTGSGLAGTTETFYAKVGTELYADYREGYFPTVQSQSLLLDIKEDNLVITFEYVQADAVPYTVNYLTEEAPDDGGNDYGCGTVEIGGKTYYRLVTSVTNNENHRAVVTEQFVPVSGFMPDAYQKRLVLTVDENGDPATDKNVINFIYTRDTQHAYYKITHYTQNLDGQTWTVYAESQAVGDIGTRYTASQMTIPGFTYDHIEYKAGEQNVTDFTDDGAKLTAAGLEINLYYVRNEYPYEVRYLEQGSNKQLAEPKKDGKGLFGAVVSENAIDIPGYDLVGDPTKTITIAVDGEDKDADGNPVVRRNIITFYYTEKEVTINYVVVGPTGCGTVSPTSEKLKVLTGTAYGSTAAASENFRFIGWFKDEACTESVDASWVVNDHIAPVKTKNYGTTDEEVLGYEAATYYAKFEYDLTDLTIVKEGWEAIDENQSFIFEVTGSDIGTMTVVIKGRGQVTIAGLRVNNTYTVKEITKWSWRYAPDAEEKSATLVAGEGVNKVTFNNTRTEKKWLNGGAYDKNVFDGTKHN